MTKEEILQRSKEENRGKDIASIEVSKDGVSVGWIVTVCLAAVVAIVDGIAFGRTLPEAILPVMGGLFIVFLVKYIKQRRRHELFVTILYGICAVCLLISWISALVKA